KSGLDEVTVLRYALFALTLPRGHLVQHYISDVTDVNVDGAAELQASRSAIGQAVYQFMHPEVGVSWAAPGEKATPKAPAAPRPAATTVTVLNGNGVAGAAANAGNLLGQLGYRILVPPRGKPTNAPSWNYVRTRVYFDHTQRGAGLAAKRVAA